MHFNWLSALVFLLVTAAQDDAERGWEYVTSGSTIKLTHLKSSTHLTMPQVSYGTGSQQQAITTHTDTASTKALWFIETAHPRGSIVKCNDKLRLMNTLTGHYLHSHDNHQSPISGNQEVSGFDGQDDGDLWQLECIEQGEGWKRQRPVRLRHWQTGKYLQSLPAKRYRQPIDGHLEVSAAKRPDTNSQWMAVEGYYFN